MLSLLDLYIGIDTNFVAIQICNSNTPVLYFLVLLTKSKISRFFFSKLEVSVLLGRFEQVRARNGFVTVSGSAATQVRM
ncbi:hypothetical protein DENSPDRAFT_1964 [Dentipellis sp. KUC8613]|nr:hypothetical protein DENSPDRAFT_1964 [Dentipellis sp. KUC8613]